MRATVRLGCCVLAVLAFPVGAQTPDSSRMTLQGAMNELARGKRAFDINCARCHGIGGNGDTGPSLARAVLPRARTDSALRTVIASGIPGTEMPRSFWLSDLDVKRIIAYVRSLSDVGDKPASGNADRGRELFTPAGCGTCHIVDGVGGVVGPELTDVGARRSVVSLRRSLLDPAAEFPRQGGRQLFAVVRAETRAGTAVTGVRVNEDTYSIQLRDAAGRFYSLRKRDLRSLQRQSTTTLMPSASGKLRDDEVDDLVAYLASLRTAR